MKILNILALTIILVSGDLVSSTGRADSSDHVSIEQGGIIVGLATNFAPYSFRNNEEELQGIGPDLWRLWSKKTGIPIHLIPIDWYANFEMLQAGRADVIGAIPKSNAMDPFLLYSDTPLVIADAFVFYNPTLPEIRDIDSLKGFPVGTVTSGACTDWLEANHIPNIRHYPNFQAMSDAVSAGELDVFCSARVNAVETAAVKTRLSTFKRSPAFFKNYIYWAVSSSNPQLHDIIQNGFLSIGDDEKQAITKVWVGFSIKSVWIHFSRSIAFKTLITVLIFAAFMVLWNIILRKQVSKKTEALRLALVQAQDVARTNTLFSALIDAVPDIAWVKDRGGRFLAVNKALYQRNNLTSPEAMLGKTDYDYSPPEWATRYQTDDAEVMRNGKTKIVEEHLVLGERSLSTHDERWVETIKAPLRDKNGQIMGTLGIAHDITGIKNSEEAFRQLSNQLASIIDNLPGDILRVRFRPSGPMNLNFIRPNQSAKGLLSHGIELEHIHPEDRHLYTQVMTTELYETGFSEQRIRVTLPNAPLSWRLLRFKVTEREGENLVADGIALDITREVLSNQALKQEEAELKRLELIVANASKMAALGSLAGGVAHNFNNLLGAIQGYAEFITEDNVDSTQTHRYATQILSATKRGAALINQILAFARERELNMTPIVLSDFMLLAEDRFLATNERSSITLLHTFYDTTSEVLADKEQLEYVVLALSMNAAESFAGQNGTITFGTKRPKLDQAKYQRLLHRSGTNVSPALEVWSDNTDDFWAVSGTIMANTNYVALTVDDTGCGMDAFQLEQVFTPFNSKGTKSLPLGLGLAAVHGIVLAHSGALVVNSKKDGGTRIEILLRRLPDDDVL